MKNLNEEVKKWKNATIIVTFILIVVSSLFLAAYVLGSKMIQADNDCNLIVCGYVDEELGLEVSSYFYDSTTNICYCYSGNEEVYRYSMK